MLSSLRAIRKFDIPVDRMERVASMPCNDSLFALMRSLDSNKDPPSNHPSEQCLIFLFFRVALDLELVLEKRIELVDLLHELFCRHVARVLPLARFLLWGRHVAFVLRVSSTPTGALKSFRASEPALKS